MWIYENIYLATSLTSWIHNSRKFKLNSLSSKSEPGSN